MDCVGARCSVFFTDGAVMKGFPRWWGRGESGTAAFRCTVLAKCVPCVEEGIIGVGTDLSATAWGMRVEYRGSA